MIRDLINEGRVAARCVARRWDYKKGHFIPYAKKSIEGAMRKYLTDTKSIVRLPQSKKKASSDKKEEKTPGSQKLWFYSYEEICDSLEVGNDEIDVASSRELIELIEKEYELMDMAGDLVSKIEISDSCDVIHITMLKIEERFKFHLTLLTIYTTVKFSRSWWKKATYRRICLWISLAQETENQRINQPIIQMNTMNGLEKW